MFSERTSLDTSDEKIAIKSHPLFPLLEYLFFKCEHATCSLNRAHTKVDADEMLAMAKLESAGREWKTGNEELDQLMLGAIRVLRIQLLELEKVDELCKDFCARYITCLKGKVTHEMLSGWSDPNDEDSCSPPPSTTPTDTDETDPNTSAILATMQTPNGRVSIPLFVPLLISRSTASTGSFTTKPKSLFKSDSLSDNRLVKRNFSSNDSTESTGGDEKIQKNLDSESIRSNGKGKRGSLPRRAVDILRAWLFQNIRHPYPSEDEKRDLCTQSGLNLLQVNNWFINARRRILQPLLDGAAAISTSEPSTSSDSQATPKSNSKKRTHAGRVRSASRYWSNGEKDETESGDSMKRSRSDSSSEERQPIPAGE